MAISNCYSPEQYESRRRTVTMCVFPNQHDMNANALNLISDGNFTENSSSWRWFYCSNWVAHKFSWGPSFGESPSSWPWSEWCLAFSYGLLASKCRTTFT